MSGILWIIIVGFVAGIIARLLSPGPNNPSGFILTTVLGIAGAFLATFIGQAIGHYGPNQGAGFITATIGALVVLFIWNRLVAQRRDFRPGQQVKAQPVVPASRAQRTQIRASRDRARCFASPGMTDAISRDQMHAGIHPHHFAGHVARWRRGEEADQCRRCPPRSRRRLSGTFATTVSRTCLAAASTPRPLVNQGVSI